MVGSGVRVGRGVSVGKRVLVGSGVAWDEAPRSAGPMEPWSAFSSASSRRASALPTELRAAAVAAGEGVVVAVAGLRRRRLLRGDARRSGGRLVAVAVFSAGETVLSPGSETDDITRNSGTSATTSTAPSTSGEAPPAPRRCRQAALADAAASPAGSVFEVFAAAPASYDGGPTCAHCVDRSPQMRSRRPAGAGTAANAPNTASGAIRVRRVSVQTSHLRTWRSTVLRISMRDRRDGERRDDALEHVALLAAASHQEVDADRLFQRALHAVEHRVGVALTHAQHLRDLGALQALTHVQVEHGVGALVEAGGRLPDEARGLLHLRCLLRVRQPVGVDLAQKRVVSRRRRPTPAA